MKQKPQTYNDGIVNFYIVTNIAKPGNTPKDGLELVDKYENTRFHNRTVGMSRYWAAMADNIKISKLIRIPYISDIDTSSVAVINDLQYEIKQIQVPESIVPKSLDLSLERLESNYEFNDN